MAAELSDHIAKTSEEISKCYGLLLSADARTSPILEKQIKGLEERQALLITTLGNTLHLHPISLASAPTLPLPPNQGKRQYHGNAVPLRRHLGVRRSLPLFAALWGGPRDPCSAVSLVCGRRCVPEEQTHCRVERPSPPPPIASPLLPHHSVPRPLFAQLLHPGAAPLSIARHNPNEVNVLGSLSALLRESDQSGADGAAVDARSFSTFVFTLARSHLLLPESVSNAPTPCLLPRSLPTRPAPPTRYRQLPPRSPSPPR